MMVVIIVAILTILAVPSMSSARMDQTAYKDAGAIMQLVRSARTRAIARGGALLITMTSSGTVDRGTFLLYENTSKVGGIPSTTCGPPTDWSGLTSTQTVALIDGVNLNGTAESDAALQTTLTFPPGTSVATGELCVCFTPVGRSYVFACSASLQYGMFAGATYASAPIEIDVTRTGILGKRSVFVPPTGMARLISKVQ
jgi:Tfp pilus assembly protein FimT